MPPDWEQGTDRFYDVMLVHVFYPVFKLEHFVILLPVSECLINFEWPFNFFFIVFHPESNIFC